MCPGTNWGMFNDLGVYGVPKAVKERKRYYWGTWTFSRPGNFRHSSSDS